MAEYKSVVEWNLAGAIFTDNRYSRGHRWVFDGGVGCPSSSRTLFRFPLRRGGRRSGRGLRRPVSVATCCGSCPSPPSGFVVESYRDEAVGVDASANWR